MFHPPLMPVSPGTVMQTRTLEAADDTPRLVRSRCQRTGLRSGQPGTISRPGKMAYDFGNAFEGLIVRHEP
jgi:hypothetical protein